MVDAITPSTISDAFKGMFGGPGVTNQIILWTQYFVIGFLILGGLLLIYFWLQYKYKVLTPKLLYSADKKYVKIVGWKKDRARNIKIGGVRKQFLLFARKKIEPFRPEDILPNNRVYCFLINDDGTYISMPNITLEEGIKFQKITPEESFWAIMQLKENAKAYLDTELAKKQMIYTLITIGICCAMVIFTVWFCLQAPQKIADSVTVLRPSLENFINHAAGVQPPG